MKVKEEIRILAFDDGPFGKGTQKTALVGVIFRGGSFMDGMLKREIAVDGTDAEHELIDAVQRMKFKDVRVILLDGITFAGFNTVNIQKIHEETKLPVVVVLRKKPNFDEFLNAIGRLPHSAERTDCVEAAGPIFWTKVGNNRLAFQTAGIPEHDAAEIIRVSCSHANMPEPLRAAHLIASGIVLGESVGRA
jgi:endonuclease V-like protein UPF0215 family